VPRRRNGVNRPHEVSEPSPGPSGSEAEAVDVDIVRTEPVAKAAVRDADRSEDLTACPDRRRQRVLAVLE